MVWCVVFSLKKGIFITEITSSIYPAINKIIQQFPCMHLFTSQCYRMGWLEPISLSTQNVCLFMIVHIDVLQSALFEKFENNYLVLPLFQFV